jgi:hypothetical protein
MGRVKLYRRFDRMETFVFSKARDATTGSSSQDWGHHALH